MIFNIKQIQSKQLRTSKHKYINRIQNKQFKLNQVKAEHSEKRISHTKHAQHSSK